MFNMKKVTILRSAVGSLPAISLIQQLRKKGVRVVGLDTDPLSVGFHFCDKSYVVPKGDNPEFLKKLIKICKIEKPNMIISGPEEEILTITKNKEIFRKQNIVILSPDYKNVKICSDKMKTYEKLEEYKFPVPIIFKKHFQYPCIIKPRNGRGGENVYKIKNKEELKFYHKKIKKPIITEFAKGDEFSVDVFADLEGNPISIIPRKRIKTESGISIKGLIVYDETIINYCKEITKKFKLVGPSCIQCFKNKKDIKFIEINNRFGGGSALSLKSDPTIITNIIRIAKGEKPIKSKGFLTGLLMLRYYEEIFLNEKSVISSRVNL
jgi:carbamoyl-phosphate synthase large subunit